MFSLAKTQKQNWKQLASVQIGGTICLPVLIVGYELAKQGHPITILSSILWGNLLLFGLALIAGYMSTKNPLTTVEHASCYFGSTGRKFFGLTLASSMLGWFAIQTQCMGTDIYHLMKYVKGEDLIHGASWKISLSVILAALMVIGAFWGLKFFTWLSNLCVPLLLGTISYAVYEVGNISWIKDFSLSSLPSLWDGKGVSLVLASSMAATIDLPTFYRHSDSQKSVIQASIANYLFAIPLVQIAGLCLNYGTQAPGISEALASNPTISWKIWVVFFMLLAGWTTNNLNLYSASLSLTSLAKSMSLSTATGLAGLIGCCLVFIPMLEQFSVALDVMGIFVIAMGGVMFMAFILESYGFSPKSFCVWMSWGIGIGAGFSSFLWPQLGSGAPVLDAGIGSILMLLISQFLNVIFKPIQQMLVEEIG